MRRSDVDQFFHWDERVQRFSPQWWRSDEQPVSLYFDHPAPDPYPINAAGTRTPSPSYRVGYSSNQGADNWLGNPIEVLALIFEDSTDGTPNADFTVKLTQIGETRELSNAPLHVRTMFGTAQFPGFLREPLFLPSQSVVQCDLDKIAGGATTARLYLSGKQIFTWSPDLLAFPHARQHLQDRVRKWMNRRRYIYPYWLTVPDGIQLAANAKTTVILRPGEATQFEAFTMAVVSTGNFGCELKEVKTGQTLMNGQVTRDNSLGNALLPMILPCKYLVPGGHFFSLRVEDLSGAPNTIWLTIAGRKIAAPIRDVREVLEDTRVVPTPADRQYDFSLAPY